MASVHTARELIEAAKAGKPTVVTRVWSLEREALRDRAEASFALALEALDRAQPALLISDHPGAPEIYQLVRRALAAMDGRGEA